MKVLLKTRCGCTRMMNASRPRLPAIEVPLYAPMTEVCESFNPESYKHMEIRQFVFSSLECINNEDVYVYIEE